MAKMRKTAPVGCLFKYFPILPAEVRIRIWKLRLKGDRHEVRIRFTYDWEFGRPTNVAIRKLSLVPPMFHVNWEARSIALKKYDLLFGTKGSPATGTFSGVWLIRNELQIVMEYS